MVGVADDLMVEILAKLPVKSLLRFHCVCRTWYSLISDPQFSNNLHRMWRPSFLLCKEIRDCPTIESILTMKDRTLTPLSLPWETELGDCYRENMCLGSCNGLVCVSHTIRDSSDFNHSTSHCIASDFIIWNPSTRKFRRLPCPIGYPLIKCSSHQTFVWFGYDESIHDYKLVWLNFSDTEPLHKVGELDVITLKSNTWRRSWVDHIAAVSLNFLGAATGVLSNGAIHWITETSFPEICILALDLATEKLRVLKFPPHAPVNQASRIGRLEGGCLCLCTYSRRELWIMKEYGVDSSWTKLVSIPYEFVDPILLSMEGKEMVIIGTMTGNLHWGGRIIKFRVEEGGEKVKNEETLAIDIKSSPFLSNVILHMDESLVSIFPTH